MRIKVRICVYALSLVWMASFIVRGQHPPRPQFYPQSPAQVIQELRDNSVDYDRRITALEALQIGEHLTRFETLFEEHNKSDQKRDNWMIAVLAPIAVLMLEKIFAWLAYARKAANSH